VGFKGFTKALYFLLTAPVLRTRKHIQIDLLFRIQLMCDNNRIMYVCMYFFIIIIFYYVVCEAIDTAATPGLLCQPRGIMKMIVEKQMDCRLAGETCPSATSIHHKIPHDQTRDVCMYKGGPQKPALAPRSLKIYYNCIINPSLSMSTILCWTLATFSVS
jgi:hypothetical protein